MYWNLVRFEKRKQFMFCGLHNVISHYHENSFWEFLIEIVLLPIVYFLFLCLIIIPRTKYGVPFEKNDVHHHQGDYGKRQYHRWTCPFIWGKFHNKDFLICPLISDIIACVYLNGPPCIVIIALYIMSLLMSVSVDLRPISQHSCLSFIPNFLRLVNIFFFQVRRRSKTFPDTLLRVFLVFRSHSG